MKKNKTKTMGLMALLIGTMSIGGIMAYFTDADTATNTFTVGKISIDLQEPEWLPPTEIVPQQEFQKDPLIKNDGSNEAFVFLKVIVPYANIVTANEDGSKNPAADTELFSFDVNTGWTELVSEKVKNTVNKTVTHLYAYTGESVSMMAPLAVDASTPALFDYVRFANVVEDQKIESKSFNVVIDAFGIQTTNLNDGKTALDGSNTDGVSTPKEVWNILKTQNPSVEVSVNEDIHTDIKK